MCRVSKGSTLHATKMEVVRTATNEVATITQHFMYFSSMLMDSCNVRFMPNKWLS